MKSYIISTCRVSRFCNACAGTGLIFTHRHIAAVMYVTVDVAFVMGICCIKTSSPDYVISSSFADYVIPS